MGELLGTATFPSGDVLLIDFGLLGMWCGDRPPALAQADAGRDFEITGPDAVAVAERIDLAVVKGRYAFDLSADGEPVTGAVSDVCRRNGLTASVRELPRVPHRDRVA